MKARISGPVQQTFEKHAGKMMVRWTRVWLSMLAVAIACLTQPAGAFTREAFSSRQFLQVQTTATPGTIIVDTQDKWLYLILDKNDAVRYRVGVGREGFGWTGTSHVSRKAEWPDWRPPASMRQRDPTLPVYMEGGPHNPMGARALYLGASLYRIHGTNAPSTIGYNTSSGCIRMHNADVIDLYSRVDVGTPVIVY